MIFTFLLGVGRNGDLSGRKSHMLLPSFGSLESSGGLIEGAEEAKRRLRVVSLQSVDLVPEMSGSSHSLSYSPLYPQHLNLLAAQ